MTQKSDTVIYHMGHFGKNLSTLYLWAISTFWSHCWVLLLPLQPLNIVVDRVYRKGLNVMLTLSRHSLNISFLRVTLRNSSKRRVMIAIII